MDPTKPRQDPDCTSGEALLSALNIRISAELHVWTIQRLEKLLLPDKLAHYPVQTLLAEIEEQKERLELKYTSLKEFLGLKEE